MNYDLEKVDMSLFPGFLAWRCPLPSPISMKQNMSALFAALGSKNPERNNAVPHGQLHEPGPPPQPVFTMEKATAIDPGTVKQAEDLFFYSLPDFSCKYRETVTRNLFGGDVPYRHIYTWDIPQPEGPVGMEPEPRPRGGGFPAGRLALHPVDEWLESALVHGNGGIRFPGQTCRADTLTFTGSGERVLVRLNKSMETMVHVSEETLSSEPVKVRSSSYQKYTVKGTLTMRNVSGRNMEFQVNKNIIGLRKLFREKEKCPAFPIGTVP